jgi:hypothetical protein
MPENISQIAAGLVVEDIPPDDAQLFSENIEESPLKNEV